MKNKFKFFAMIALSVTIVSCEKDPTVEPKPDPTPTPTPTGYTVPTTYNFSNVNYSGQTTRIIMLDSISDYMKKGNNGVPLDASKMKNMYANANNPFNNSSLDGSGKQLKDKTYFEDRAYFDALFDSLANVSQSATNVGSNGTAGVVTSNDGAKKYLFNANGVEYAQIIRKQLMGAVFYYQAGETYLAKLPSADNTTETPGEGTKMEHYVDEAFGYLGVPIDFPTNTTGLKYWGDYSNKINYAIGSNKPLMDAFLKLRAAVSNDDYTTRDAQVVVIRDQWERVVAGSAIYELVQAKKTLADDANRNHYLSEAVGFIKSLKYSSTKKITQTQIDAAVNALGTNYYNISSADIDNSINIINTHYSFDISKF